MFQKSVFGDLVTVEELNGILSRGFNDHPLVYLNSEVIDSNGDFDCELTNVINSFRTVKKANQTWFNKHKKRLLKEKTNNANGILGEFRCYSELINLFGKTRVTPVKTEENTHTPDFCVTFNGTKLFIEVNAPQMNEDEYKKTTENQSTANQNGTAIHEKTIVPLGIKSGMTKRQSAISKICGIKNNVEQLKGDDVSILYLDFQSEYIDSVITYHGMPKPYVMVTAAGQSADGYCSNILWYSLYAKKGTPIYNGETPTFGEGNKVEIKDFMMFNGKFSNNGTSNVSAVIYSFPSKIILCENPFAKAKIGKKLFKKILTWERFSLENSLISYPNIDIKSLINNQTEELNQIKEKDLYSW